MGLLFFSIKLYNSGETTSKVSKSASPQNRILVIPVRGGSAVRMSMFKIDCSIFFSSLLFFLCVVNGLTQCAFVISKYKNKLSHF